MSDPIAKCDQAPSARVVPLLDRRTSTRPECDDGLININDITYRYCSCGSIIDFHEQCCDYCLYYDEVPLAGE
jgi:hypothetical protein